ncbi:MAG: hypothetical protein P8X46_03010 [Nitrospirales bacterium]
MSQVLLPKCGPEDGLDTGISSRAGKLINEQLQGHVDPDSLLSTKLESGYTIN